MEPRPDFFPVYISGQYLTSENLNATHDFLWQEEKATRYSLIGNGIVQGLEADVTGNAALQTIKLTPGSAVTTDGYLVREEKNIVFDRGLPIDLVECWLKDTSHRLMEKKVYDEIKAELEVVNEIVWKAVEVIPDSVAAANVPDGTKSLTDASIGITAAQALSTWGLAAWVNISDAENNHCQQGDCNTKGVQRNFKTRYFLVKKSQLAELNILSLELETCAVCRIEKLSDSGSVTGLNKKAWDTWNKSLAEIQPYFSKNQQGKQLTYVTDHLAFADVALLDTAIAKLASIAASVNAENCPQYYVLFAGDLAKAINELVLFYNDYVRRFPAMSTARIERTIVIGGFRQTGFDTRRYYFMPAPVQVQQAADKKRLRQLLMRLFALVNNFTVQSKINAQAALTIVRPQMLPSIAAGQVLLQNCAIPYYYNVLDNGPDNEVLKNWNPQGGKLHNITCYYDSKIPERQNDGAKMKGTDWYYYNFFRLEGHLGMPKTTVISNLRLLINTWGIPVQLLDCDVTYKGPDKWKGWYENFVVNINKWAVQLRKDYPDIGDYTFSPIKKIQEGITQTSFRDVEGVIKVFNDFTAYSGVMYSGPKQGLKEKKEGIGNKVGVPLTAYEHYSKNIPKDVVLQMSTQVKDILAEQAAAAPAAKLILLSDLKDLEYMGGALRGGTLVLLHDGQKIVGDGCLSYFYRVDKERMFDAGI